MPEDITGMCRHGVHCKAKDPCYHCGFCTIDGNDYSMNLRDVPYEEVDN